MTTRRLALVRVGVGLTVSAVGALVFVLNQEDAAVSNDVLDRARPAVRAVLPEQWGFFTRSPREPSVVALTADGLLAPNVQGRYLLGADRTARAAGIEIGVVLESVPETSWSRCPSEDIESCRSSVSRPTAPPAQRVAGSPHLCGDVTLIRFTPAPWAYITAGTAADRLEAVRVRATC